MGSKAPFEDVALNPAGLSRSGQPNDSALRESALLRAVLASPLAALPPRLLARAALALEGGQLLSRTLRRLLWQHNGVIVGAYSYGGMLEVTRARRDGLVIGRYVSLSVTARWGLNHRPNRIGMSPVFDGPDAAETRQGLVIGSDSWIGDFAVVTGSCHRIGIGAVVGAGAVVTRDVPDFAIVTGAPARVRRYRFPESVQERILASRWWERDLDELAPWMSEFRLDAVTPQVLAALDRIQALAPPAG
ncbi:hypothetical protein [Methylobacterium sp. ID0610]|uniref:hypothetical protein n=1 Tax=Methylobacterium carpenticola TaxID=3344827 RepID=UPI003688A545